MNDEAELYYAEFMKALAGRIKTFRKERGLSLRDMVVKHNYHDSQWRKYEREGASSVGSLLRIARALDTTLTVLLDDLGDYPKKSVESLLEGHADREIINPQTAKDGRIKNSQDDKDPSAKSRATRKAEGRL